MICTDPHCALSLDFSYLLQSFTRGELLGICFFFLLLKSLLFMLLHKCVSLSEIAEDEWKKHRAVQEMMDPGPILELMSHQATRTDLKLLWQSSHCLLHQISSLKITQNDKKTTKINFVNYELRFGVGKRLKNALFLHQIHSVFYCDVILSRLKLLLLLALLWRWCPL